MKCLTCADFSAHLNTGFKATVEEAVPELDSEAQYAELTLVSADARDDGTCEHFSLIFDGPQNPVLPQRTYAMSHAAMGNLELFITPVMRSDGGEGCQYQAVFNRLKGGGEA